MTIEGPRRLPSPHAPSPFDLPELPVSEHLHDFVSALRPRLAGDLRTDAVSRALYATDASMYKMMPVGVLIPRHMDDVHAAVEVAARFGVPVLPRGGGSSLAGQTVKTALVIDFSQHLDQVLEVNPEERWVRVQPGITHDVLNLVLGRHGLMIGPDPASSNRATLGGMVGNNATGTHSILYGNVINHIRSVRTFLADGSTADFGPLGPDAWAQRTRRSGLEGDIYRGLDALLREQGDVVARDTPKHWRRNSGYRLEYLLGDERNVAQLLCGSEGTLAVTTEVTLGLVPRPTKTILGVVHFRTLREALRSVTAILETGPSAVELFDGTAIEQTRRAPGYAHRLTFVEGDPGAVLITEYYGETDAELASKLQQLQNAMARGKHGYAVVPAVTPQQIQNVWTVRKEGLGLIMGVQGDHKPHAFIEDASVPVEHLADYVDGLLQVHEETNTRVVLYAHASAGCLHVRPFINTKDAREVEKMKEIAVASMELVRQYGGAVSSEHGDGIARSWLLEGLVGPELYDVYRQVKRTFDPRGLLNPRNVVDAPPMTEHLRMGPDYRTIPVLQEMDFSESGGFAGMVELCNGNGACRKLQSGTMCPSFMVTREEEHSTRGRANALRAAMSGEVPVEEFTGQRVYEVLDLCVQCKGCKTECPSNVDMAKLKTAWLSKYWEANEMPLRTKLFAHMPRLTRMLTGPLAASVNWVNERKATRKLMAKTLGISDRRKLPAFAVEPFTTWFRKQKQLTSGRPQVVLFADTFNNYNHPETARAAAEFLDAIGFDVVVPGAKACCGRPLLSKGLVSEAQILALQTVERLHPYAAQGLPIVGLEPSCILTFRDEFLSLLPGDIRTREVAAVTRTFEEFVDELARDGRLDGVRWKAGARDVLLHGHCHQKAIVGTGPAERVLALPGYTVTTVDSGCCGMAGSFGYEAEHYGVSIAMAERRLAPAVRAADEATIVAAPGVSCRSQIFDTTGRQALHPAEILRDALQT